MDATQFEHAAAKLGFSRVDRWHLGDGSGTLVCPGAVSRSFEGQLAFLERRKAAIDAVAEESRKDRQRAGRSRRKDGRRRRQ